ncbi:MAG: hypothetical protein BMS9Abin13_547 [Patescibacteria group bacterium]|nr:MAG: hypothetical protein BMS9Abin13_547 [Patescibacteria group bacterium]
MGPNDQKGFVQIPVLIAVFATIALLGAAGYGGFWGYGQYKTGQQEKEQRLQEYQELLTAQQKALEETSEELKKLKTESEERTKEIEDNLEAEKAKRIDAERKTATRENAAQQRIDELENKLSRSQVSLADIIGGWRPIIARVECDFRYSTGASYLKQGGSGVIVGYRDGTISVLTSKHITQDAQGYKPYLCNVSLPEDNGSSIPVYGNTSIGWPTNSEYDFADLFIDNPSQYVRDLASPGFAVCEGKAAIGESVVILGYPSIGSQTGITATEGIISGYDGDYYITSAKVERGNSGGAAISVKGNCYLGIPTLVRTGQIESLARILDTKIMFTK